MEYKKNFKLWNEYNDLDSELKEELKYLSKKEIEDSFYKDLEFGTGGMRGIMGPGTNRMNIYTQMKINQAFANYIVSQGEEAMERGVVIAYDCRFKSLEFAKIAASVLATNKIKVYLFDSLRPTPLLSYSVRHLNAFGGIVITASHNPPNYNGYKVYNEDGCQYDDNTVTEITNEFKKIKDMFSIKTDKYDELLKTGMINILTAELDDIFEKDVIESQTNTYDETDILVVFTPMHGTSYKLGPSVLKNANYKCITVDEQMIIDPTFKTVESPNPEDIKSFKMAEEYGHMHNADLLIATDPDADRMRIAVLDDNNEYYHLTGNQTAALFTKYIIEQYLEKKDLTGKEIMFDTVVSSSFAKDIAESYNIATISTLTGFKNIGTAMKKYIDELNYHFIIGYEESIGYVIKPYVRDKDSITATLLAAEICQYYKNINITLFQQLNNLYKEYGYYVDGAKSIVMPGIEGVEKIKRGIAYFRENMPCEILGKKVIKVEDFKTQSVYRLTNDKMEKSEETLNYDSSNFLKYYLEDNSFIIVRPSGTEPKIKIYVGVKKNTFEEARQLADNLVSYCENILTNV